MTNLRDIADIRNYLYNKSEKWWLRSLVLAIITPAASVLAVWYETTWVLFIAGLLSVLAPVGIKWARAIAEKSSLRADKCRRLIVFENGLGVTASKEDLAEVRSWAMNVDLKKAPFAKPYYLSTKQEGSNRLADIVAESAFFTDNLAGKVAYGLWVLFAAASLATVVILFTIVQPMTAIESRFLIIVKSLIVVISFLISGDLLLLAKKFGDLKETARRTFDRCALMREHKSLSVVEVLPVVEDYGIALLQSPPIPFWLYKRYCDELNRVYRESHSSEENRP